MFLLVICWVVFRHLADKGKVWFLSECDCDTGQSTQVDSWDKSCGGLREENT